MFTFSFPAMSGYCYGCGKQQPPPQLPYSSDGNNPPYGHQLPLLTLCPTTHQSRHPNPRHRLLHPTAHWLLLLLRKQIVGLHVKISEDGKVERSKKENNETLNLLKLYLW
ncbi:hypothetical protein F2Q70_00040925 [Brassica cretica]|uniref:Uncharacterized protein n=1 Tax=Brassica cretica TaxID=69181 RepID=A0A8S9K377_BRACR|nr:hypothetical protein F2Q70_00040925 [Brassica cretica]